MGSGLTPRGHGQRYHRVVATAARGVHYTYEQYLLLERDSLTKHEYLDGEIYALAGGSPEHAALAATVIALLRNRLPLGCRVFTSDLRVRIPPRASRRTRT